MGFRINLYIYNVLTINDEATEEQAASTQETAASSNSLAKLSEDIKSIVDKFRL